MAAYFTRSGGSPLSPPGLVQKISSNYQVQPTDYYIGCNGIGITVTLPANSLYPGKSYYIKDESGQASRNPIILSGNGNTIDGSATITFTMNYISVQVLWTGSGWSII